MLLDKKCVSINCTGIAAFGFGLPSRSTMRWACRVHRDLIWTGADAASKGDGRTVNAPSVRPSSLEQGRLFG